MLIQAGEYEECYGLDLGEFYNGTPLSISYIGIAECSLRLCTTSESMDAQSNSTEKEYH